MEKKTPIKVKTYGVRGLMEWWVELPTHQEKIKTVKVMFTGGQISGYRISPARFTTADPVLQEIIEQSDHFRKNRIYLMNVR